MNPVLQEMLYYMLAFSGIIISFFFLLNFLTKGFIWTYLVVKASQGRKVLVRIHSAVEIYHKAGSWSDGFLFYKTKGKEKKQLPITNVEFRQAIFQQMGVPLIEVDESGNKILLKDLQVASFQVDSGELETILLRIKNRPQLASTNEKIILIMLVLILLGLAYAIFVLYQQGEIITGITNLVGNV